MARLRWLQLKTLISQFISSLLLVHVLLHEFFTYFPMLDRENPRGFKNMNKPIYIPGLPPIPLSDIMPVQTLDRNSKSYSDFLQFSHCLPKSDGIIINMFGSLEPKPTKAITDGVCVQDGHTSIVLGRCLRTVLMTPASACLN